MVQENAINLGDALFADINENPYLNELYGNILYNYSVGLFGMSGARKKTVNIMDALGFADILSKSTDPQEGDKHRLMSQEIVALLKTMEPDNDIINYYLGSVLLNTGNFLGMAKKTPNHRPQTILHRLYTEFIKDYMRIPAEPENQFFRTQKLVYDRLNDPYFSYSGPTSMGKSYIMRMFIKKQIMDGTKANFALLVPTKALINEVSGSIIHDLKGLLAEHNYRLVTSANAHAVKKRHNFIFVLTPERLLYLLIGNPNIGLDYLFVDEAHKISTKGSRSTFYYKVVDMIGRKEKKTRIIFSSPNIPNPEIYLKLIPDTTADKDQKLATTFAPVSQVKYLIDCPNGKVKLFNNHSGGFTHIAQLEKSAPLNRIMRQLGRDSQNIVYCNSIDKTVRLAREYAEEIPYEGNDELMELSRDIRREIHEDYYLADVVSRGVAYHIGYLPPTIRVRIEELYRKGLIRTIFCTSTLVEGVNLPADNLFITHYRNGKAKMSAVDFKNLIGRVGRIEYNLFGNVFLVRLEENVKREEFVRLLKKDVPNQRLSLVTELTKKQKSLIVDNLQEGKIELPKHPKNQTADSYTLMRKFAVILLRDIAKGRKSLVWREFQSLLNPDIERRIIAAFREKGKLPKDDDINISVDQLANLTTAIEGGLKYPETNEDGYVDYCELMRFLERLCKIFKWEIYERQTLGHKSKNGTHGKLRWYAVLLARWIKGMGLGFIMEQSIRHKQENPESGVWQNHKKIPYNNSKEHRNIIISQTLQAIQDIVLFSISNYFLRFSAEYKRYHGIESFHNDWYEYVEYGTTNPLSIELQRHGFSRETSAYIKRHRHEFVATRPGGEIKLRKSLTACDNVGVRNEVAKIKYNAPELFVW